MKYKLGDEVYLKGVITNVNSCAEINYPYEVKAADEFVLAAEQHLEPINKEEAPLCLRNVLARLRGLPEHDREVWLKNIMDEFELDFSHAKWREGYEQGKFEGAVEAEKSNKVVIPQFVADWIEVCKEHLTTSLYTAMSPNFMKENSQSFDLILWIKKTSNQDIFARAWLDGYEVEKEKLYTARLKLVTFEEESYLKKHCRKDDFSIGNSSEFGNYQTSFTQSELEELNVWDNPAFEIEEKEND